MAGKKPRLSSLAAHKQLLIAESELNRTLLKSECEQLRAGVHKYVGHVKHYGSFLSGFKFLWSAFLAFQAAKPEPAPQKRSWLSRIVRGAVKVSDLWSSFKSRGNGS